MAEQLISKYGLKWDPWLSPLEIEFQMIRQGGMIERKGKKYGEGLLHHYREAQKLAWPDDDVHRWSDLILRRIIENEVTVIMGPGDSAKTFSVSKFVLIDWWCFPENTLWMLSSTELRGAELRIWGAIKLLFNRGREINPWLPGTVLESKHAITTEEISDDGSEGRLLTKGLIFIPCKQGGRWVGMGAYAGVKPVRHGKLEGRLGHVGDEGSAMERAFLDAYSNWYGKENFRGIITGNPYDTEDTLCVAGEPLDGWDTWTDTEKTQEWKSKFYHAQVISLDGRDSPNFDYPKDQPTRFKYLVGPKKIEAVAKTHGRDSWQFFNQCVGKPRAMGNVKRVLTRQLCENNGVFDSVIWEGSDTIKVAFLDAAYGGVGGDRCMAGHLEFGKDVNGKSVMSFHPLVMVPVSVNNPETPEVQISRFMKHYCFGYDIPAQNCFFDGRSTLAIEMARTWSPDVNVVDFGGTSTKRPVSLEEFIYDDENGTRRLKRCEEHYSKFVSELWFTVYYLCIGQQLRQFPKDAASEGYKREWRYTTGNRIEVETKAEMKERTNQSPDCMDCVVAGIEGARRLGFVIENMRDDRNEKREEQDADWLGKEFESHRKLVKKRELTYN